MASVRVVGQPGPRRLDPEPPRLLLKLSGAQTKVRPPRRSSWERLMLARSCEDFEPRPPPLPPRAAGGAAGGGGRTPGGGCGSAAPRSPPREAGGGSPRARAGRLGTSREADRSAPPGESGLGAAPSGPAGSLRHRDSTAAPQSASSPGDCGGLRLERLTQGRTGVVKLARAEPHRIQAWCIFPRQVDPRVRTERGEGHRFETQPVNQDWCDVCSREISAQVVKCQSK